MPAPRRPRLPRELFETRSHAWHSLGLGDELAPKFSKRQFGGLLLALLVIAGTLFVYYQRKEIAPGYGQWIRIGTAIILVTVGSAAAHWLVRGLSPRLYRRLDPATAGTTGFVIRLLATAAVVVLALRIVGVNSSTLAVGGAFTAVLLGLAAQQAMSGDLRRHRPAEHAAVPGRRTGAPGRRRPGRLAGGNRHLARPLLHHPQPGRRPAPGAQQRPPQPRRRAAARARQSRRAGALPGRRPTRRRSRNGCCRRSPSPPATSRASRSRSSTATWSSSASARPRCEPKTARSWPRRCSTRCGARNR